MEMKATDGERRRRSGKTASGPLTAPPAPVPEAGGARRWKPANLDARGMLSRSPDSSAVSRETKSSRLRASKKPTTALNLPHGPQLASYATMWRPSLRDIGQFPLRGDIRAGVGSIIARNF
jgi:hypothetical protein